MEQIFKTSLFLLSQRFVQPQNWKKKKIFLYKHFWGAFSVSNKSKRIRELKEENYNNILPGTTSQGWIFSNLFSLPVIKLKFDFIK